MSYPFMIITLLIPIVIFVMTFITKKIAGFIVDVILSIVGVIFEIIGITISSHNIDFYYYFYFVYYLVIILISFYSYRLNRNKEELNDEEDLQIEK